MPKKIGHVFKDEVTTNEFRKVVMQEWLDNLKGVPFYIYDGTHYQSPSKIEYTDGMVLLYPRTVERGEAVTGDE